VYAHGVWFYFPAAFVIKSTLPVLALLAVTLWAIAAGRFRREREIVFLVLPATLYMLVAMSSGLNIGARHILPLWVFSAVLVSGTAVALMYPLGSERQRLNRGWVLAIAVLLVFQAVTSLHTFPHYISYENEAFGGPANTHRYLSDSNVDWGQQLHFVKQYVDEHHIRHCWFAYFIQGGMDPRYYVPECDLLPTFDSVGFNQQIDAPSEVDGPVLISAGTVNGFEFGSELLNPYEDFMRIKPDAEIANAVFVYNGHFPLHHAAALSHVQRANNLLQHKQVMDAESEARKAVDLYPESLSAQVALGDALAADNRKDEARSAYGRAMAIARRMQRGADKVWSANVQQKIDALH
jgi:hypothetical protein